VARRAVSPYMGGMRTIPATPARRPALPPAGSPRASRSRLLPP